jgi:hypothetical protein
MITQLQQQQQQQQQLLPVAFFSSLLLSKLRARSLARLINCLYSEKKCVVVIPPLGLEV